MQIHPTADVQSDRIGQGTRIWQCCVVLPGAVIGSDCNINAHCLVEDGATIGDRVTLKCGVYVWSGVTLEDDVFVGPNATFTNDPTPRSRQRPSAFSETHVARGASIGAQAVLIAPLTIGQYAMIGAGAVVTRDVPAYGLVAGHPARRVGWVCVCGQRLPETNRCEACGREYALRDGALHLVEPT